MKTSETKHTPGPWGYGQVEEGIWGIYFNPDGYDIEDAAVYMRDTEDDRSEADARLIAAAPDLLEALTELLRMIDAGVSAETMISCESRNISSVLGDARVAIAKAEGRS